MATKQNALEDTGNPRRLVVSHGSALQFWRRARRAAGTPGQANRDTLIEPEYLTRRLGVPETSASSSAMLAKSAAESLGIQIPIRSIVTRLGDRRNSSSALYRVCTWKIPAEHLIRLNSQIIVCSPELALYQISPKCDTTSLAQLMSELCGTYVLTPDKPDGFTGDLACITTSERLRNFLALGLQSPKTRGAVKFEQAIRLSAEHSASPAESKLATLLCGPTTLGGFGLKGATLNHEIPFTREAARLTRRDSFRPDLLWPGSREIVEYNGSIHGSQSSIEDDADRLNALASMGYRVTTVTRRQTRSLPAITAIAQGIAERIGMGELPRSPTLMARRRVLHGSLYGIDMQDQR